MIERVRLKSTGKERHRQSANQKIHTEMRAEMVRKQMKKGFDPVRIKKEELRTRQLLIHNGSRGHPTLPDRRRLTFNLNRTVAKRIIALIEDGLPYGTVCKYVGVLPATFNLWLEKGIKGTDPDYADFYCRVAKADAMSEQKRLKNMYKHESFDWRVSAWLLERRYPENWGKNDDSGSTFRTTNNFHFHEKHELGRAVIDNNDARQLARHVIESQGGGGGFTRIADDVEIKD